MNRNHLNRLLLLHALKILGEKKGKTLFLQPLIFTIQQKTRKKGISKTFNYNFIRWHLGPYSKELEYDYLFLVQNGFIDKDKEILSEKGEKFINKGKYLLERFFFIDGSILEEDVNEAKKLDISDFLLEVYEKHELKKHKKGKTIAEVLFS